MAESEREHEQRTLPLRGAVLFAAALVGAIAFTALALLLVAGHADAFDRRWTLAFHRLDNIVLDWIFIALTTLGSGIFLWLGIALVSFLAIRKRRWPYAAILVANGIVSSLLDVGLKHWFVRPRPILFEKIARPDTYSFPSGHAMSAVQVVGALAAILIALYPARRTPIVVCACVLIVGIGLSRVYLGVHWPTDVAAGFAAGAPFLAVTVHLSHRVERTVGATPLRSGGPAR